MARRSPVPSREVVSFDLNAPEGTTFRYNQIPAVSPDGERIAFVAHDTEGRRRLFLKSLRGASATIIPGTEGASQPFWSADGGEIAFATVGQLKRVAASGGSPQVLCAVDNFATGDEHMYGLRGATWSAEGSILFADADGQLWRTSTKGEKPTPAARLFEGERGRYWPQFLPDGRRYLYWSRAIRAGSHGVYVASLDSDERTLVLTSDLSAAYSAGHLLFQTGNTLMAQGFDVSRLQLSGEARPVAESVAAVPVPGPFGHSYAASYSASADGVVAWQTGSPNERTVLTWFDRSGRKLGTLGEPAVYSTPALSPDGTSVAVGVWDSATGTRDIWVFDATRGTGRRLTFDRADDLGPAWSPDGKWIVFASDRGGAREIYRKLADGSGGDERILASRTESLAVMDLSADGRFLIYNHRMAGKPMDLQLLPLGPSGPGTPKPLLGAPSVVEDRGQFDASGRFIAYDSDESGRMEAYVVGVSQDGDVGAGKWQISTEGGFEPRWRRDGKELFYVFPGLRDRVMAVDVRINGASLAAGAPQALFEVSLPADVRRNRFVVSPDGQRFLVNARADAETNLPLRVLVNWPSVEH
jgi:eukaryotic-like serine/threonine-protein kinase